MLLDSGVSLFVTFIFLVLGIAMAYNAVVIVRPDERAAYMVLGKYRGMLDPGLQFVWPFVSDIHCYEESSTRSVTEAANTADGGRVEATVRVEFERGDIERAYETDADLGTGPIPELRDEARELLRSAVRDRDTEAALSAHVDIERALARELQPAARELFYHLQGVDTLAIERVERPPAPQS